MFRLRPRMIGVRLRHDLCSKRRVVHFVWYAMRSSKDEEVNYHEGVDKHERYWVIVNSKYTERYPKSVYTYFS